MLQKRRGSARKVAINTRAISLNAHQSAEGVAPIENCGFRNFAHLRSQSYGEAPHSDCTYEERADGDPSIASQRSPEQQHLNQKLEKTETVFFQGLIELQYGQNVEKKLRSLAAKIPWAHGWPTEKQAFWNAEAFMWQRKINKQQRHLITQEIKQEIKQEVALLAGRLPGKRNLSLRNLDLGCGAYSYLHSTAGVDLSAKMLALNERLEQKIPLDLENLKLSRQRLPLPSAAFDSVTAVFLLNYLPEHAHPALFQEIRRVLKKKGVLIVVLAATPLQHRYGRQERAKLSFGQWKRRLRLSFQVKAYTKEKMWFFCCRK